MFYDSYWSRVISELNTIVSAEEQLKFLFNKKGSFVGKNTGFDAELIIKQFDNEIERIKSLASIPFMPAPSEEKRVLTIPQRAALMAYEGKKMSKEDASKIAASYGFVSKSSGNSLYQDFAFYSIRANRRAKPNPFTITKLRNKITFFEGIVEMLPEHCKQRAIDDLNHLKSFPEEQE